MTEEIIKRLKDSLDYEFQLSFKDRKQLLDYITNLQQENEKLKYNARGQVNDYFKDKYADEVLKSSELKKENERLNNIINELEKYISQEWYCFDNESVEFEISKNILDKLKELKENGNNEN